MLDSERVQLLERIADREGTPTFVYFEETIREQIGRVRGAFGALPGRLLYAMKANSHPAVLEVVRDEGLGIDAVSPAELLLALRAGFAPEDIFFSANNMTDTEMHFAQAQGVLLNIGELSRLHRYGEAYPGSPVCIRLNPQIGAGHHEHVITAGSLSKFGVPVAQAEAALEVARAHDLSIIGLHQHIGSGILDADTLWAAIEVMLDAAGKFPGIRFLNLGGGLGVPYEPGEETLDLEQDGEILAERLNSFVQSSGGIEIWFEPGRYYTAQSGVLLTRVNTVKDNGDRVFVGLDTGMNHLVRPALYGSYHHIVNLSNPDGPTTRYDVVGNICETGDTFARDRMIPEVREGDVMAILDTGAYASSMSSLYNLRPQPAEIWVADDRYHVITPRMTPGELVAHVLRQTRPVRR